MIVKSSFRRAGGLEAHLLRTATNETVRVRTDLFRGADDLHAALQLMEALARTNPRVTRSFVHIVISPDHVLTEPELAEALAMVEAEHGLSLDSPRAVVTHLKGARATHIHAVYPIVDPATGKAVRSDGNFERDEIVSRRLEIAFGERIVPGPCIEANVAELRHRGLDQEADVLAPYAPVRHEDGLSRADRQQASRLGVNAAEWSRRAFALFERTGRDFSAFAGLLDGAGLRVARDTFSLDGARDEDRATLLVDDATGFATSLVRLLRREAKATGRPLAIREAEIATAFPDAPPFTKARDHGLERARQKAGREVEIEYRTASTEALVDGNVADIEAFRIRRRRQAEEAEGRARDQLQATLKGRREEIQALYRRRDETRRRRVDRAFRQARLFETPQMRKLLFGLGASGVLLTGGSLGLAFAGGVLAMGLLPSRAQARAMAASASRERAEDAAKRRTETDGAYRQARAATHPVRSGGVRFTFEHVAKQDRVLAGLYAEALLRGDTLSADAMAAGQALGGEIVAGLTRMLERGSPLQVRRLQHWYRGVAPHRRSPAVAAALARHAGSEGRPTTERLKRADRRPAGRGRTKPNRNGGFGL